MAEPAGETIKVVIDNLGCFVAPFLATTKHVRHCEPSEAIQNINATREHEHRETS
jgi:hypothetical protein